MNYMHSSEKIKGLRIHQGYTVEQLAEEANISTKFLYEIEAISKALNVSCDYILNDSNQQTVPDFIIELVKKLDSKEQVAVEHILVEIIRLREE